jgi:CHASE1-domain containing sensor protein
MLQESNYLYFNSSQFRSKFVAYVYDNEFKARESLQFINVPKASNFESQSLRQSSQLDILGITQIIQPSLK